MKYSCKNPQRIRPLFRLTLFIKITLLASCSELQYRPVQELNEIVQEGFKENVNNQKEGTLIGGWAICGMRTNNTEMRGNVCPEIYFMDNNLVKVIFPDEQKPIYSSFHLRNDSLSISSFNGKKTDTFLSNLNGRYPFSFHPHENYIEMILHINKHMEFLLGREYREYEKDTLFPNY